MLGECFGHPRLASASELGRSARQQSPVMPMPRQVSPARNRSFRSASPAEAPMDLQSIRRQQRIGSARGSLGAADHPRVG